MNKKEFQKALGQRIKQLREDKNITQTELGNLCDIERTNMNRIEAGNTNPTSYTLYRIAQKLEVDLPELFELKPGIQKK